MTRVIRVSFKAILTSKSMTRDPTGTRIIRMEFIEERDMPTPVIMGQDSSGIVREIAPVVQQVVRSMPFIGGGKYTMPRLTLWLTEDEWDKLEPKPEIGDEIEVLIEGNKVTLRYSKE